MYLQYISSDIYRFWKNARKKKKKKKKKCSMVAKCHYARSRSPIHKQT